MQIVSVNSLDDIKKYGITKDILNYKNNDNFKGHCVAVSVCMVDCVTGRIEKSYLPDDDENNSLAMQILTDENISLVSQVAMRLTKENFSEKTLYALPFIPENHISLKPEISADKPIDKAYSAKFEVVFSTKKLKNCYYMNSYDNYKCYLEMSNCGPGGYLDIDSILEEVFEETDNFLEAFPDVDIVYDQENDNYGFTLEFYNDFGEKANLFLSLDALKDMVTSTRLIELTEE